VEKGDQIAQLIIEKIDHRELQEGNQLGHSERGDQGFGSSDTTMNQKVKGREASQRSKSTRYQQDLSDSSTEEEKQPAF